MTARRFRTVLFALALLAGPGAAGAQTFGVPNADNAAPAGSPVQIEDCKAGQTGGFLLAKSDGAFVVSFTNESNVTANLIRFHIDYGNESLFIRDVGKFSPGITIRHVFKNRGDNVVSSPLFHPAKLNCSVAAVHFVNGTDWTPTVAAASQAAVRGYLGVQLKQEADGVYVSLVFPGSPADLAGIHQGDRIANIETNAITTRKEARELIDASPPGTKLHITIVRNNSPMNVVATVAAEQGTTASKE